MMKALRNMIKQDKEKYSHKLIVAEGWWDWDDLALTGVGSLVVVWFGVTYRLWGWSYSR